MIQEQLYREYVTKDGVLRFVCEARPDNVPEGITEVHVLEVETSERFAGRYFKLRGAQDVLQGLCRDVVSTRDEDFDKGLVPEMFMSFYTLNGLDDFRDAWDCGSVTAGLLSDDVKQRGSLFIGLMRVRWVLQHMRMALVGSDSYFRGWEQIATGYARLYGVPYFEGSPYRAAYDRLDGVQALDLTQAPSPGDAFDFRDHQGSKGRMFHIAAGVYASFTPTMEWQDTRVKSYFPDVRTIKRTRVEGYITFFHNVVTVLHTRLPVVPICDLEDMMYVHAYLSSIPGVNPGDVENFCVYVENVTGLDEQRTGGQSNV